MAPEKAPAFQFYPKDFLSDPRVMAMSLEQRGAYITLLCLCWTETTLPMDVESLSRMLHCSPTAFTKRIWPALQACFQVADDGFRQKRLDEERDKQSAYRQSQKDRADKRWHKSGNAVALPAQSQRNALPSSSSSSSVEHTEDARVFPSRISEMPTDEIGTRAAAFIDRYAELYPLHRGGARFLPRPALDYQTACDLCRTWPDERLEKLAIVFLKTDHEFAASGSRTLRQFAALASWCDGRLAEVEKARA